MEMKKIVLNDCKQIKLKLIEIITNVFIYLCMYVGMYIVY